MNKSKESGKFFATIQQVGKSFFLPVSVLPIAGLLLGLGSSFTNQTTIETYHLTGLLGSGTVLNGLLTIMSQVGTAIFGNLPLIFALAVALGMARKEKAVAVLSSGIAFIVMHTSINAMLKISGYILPDYLNPGVVQNLHSGHKDPHPFCRFLNFSGNTKPNHGHHRLD